VHECTLSITVLKTSSSGEHKFKVAGIIVMENPSSPGFGEDAPFEVYSVPVG
jgi:hypothetical protein